jgi:hypothetical protein
MLRTLDDPRRLARTYALVIPGWFNRRFNLLAERRGYCELPPPSENVAAAFEAASVPITTDGPLGTRVYDAGKPGSAAKPPVSPEV